MATARPFAYNSGSTISGTQQIGDLSIGTPTSGFTTNPQYWNGPDEELGYIIAISVSGNTQPTPISGVTASVGFNRSEYLTENSFVNLTNVLFGQNFTGGTECKTWLNLNGYWTSYQIPIITNGLVLNLDASNPSSYPGSGTIWYDISGNGFNSTLINGPTYSSDNGGVIVLDGINDWVSIPGNTTIYSSDFTWQTWHYFRTGGQYNLDGLFWSELAGTKNFLTGYRNTDTINQFFRIDTSSEVYQSPLVGTQYNNFYTPGTTPLVGRWAQTTLVKSGNSFTLYWNDSFKLWNVTIDNWSMNYTSQDIAYGARNDGNYASPINTGSIFMYNRSLSEVEITSNYNATKTRFGL